MTALESALRLAAASVLSWAVHLVSLEALARDETLDTILAVELAGLSAG